MKKNIAIAFCFIIIGLTGCPEVFDIKENSKYLEIKGLEFRKKGSINTDLLWAGVGRSDSVNSFDPKFLPKLEKAITARKVTEAFNDQTRKAAYEAAAKAGIEIAEGNVSGAISTENSATGLYHVFILFDVNDFVTELNSEQNREGLELLMKYDRPRVVTSIATVFNRKSNNKIITSGNVYLKIKNPQTGSPEFSIKQESTGETIATLSDGTVFAYEYARLCWEKKDGKVKVATIEVDRPGFDNNCPSGTKDKVSKL
ncbi:hypothetical protein AU255_10625 [Methyloprofundus sedimenti]|uniref:Uncharacterized protein n=1 Tax=Methyloprofundus sedimenti TaxID=1420851 RepID=A0A1V8M9P8_9GAMM|nr:hypothetical protein [Methyloprofundus sedimenti]OQK18256.1 hypothetical protein AU255_10625 [Methyloprofundus sedimenti]